MATSGFVSCTTSALETVVANLCHGVALAQYEPGDRFDTYLFVLGDRRLRVSAALPRGERRTHGSHGARGTPVRKLRTVEAHIRDSAGSYACVERVRKAELGHVAAVRNRHSPRRYLRLAAEIADHVDSGSILSDREVQTIDALLRLAAAFDTKK